MDGQDNANLRSLWLLEPLDVYFGGVNVANITTDVLRDFSSKRMQNGGVGPTVNRNLAMLRRLFKLAERQSKVSNVPYFDDAERIEAAQRILEAKAPQASEMSVSKPRSRDAYSTRTFGKFLSNHFLR
jgi:hypothetical protein